MTRIPGSTRFYSYPLIRTGAWTSGISRKPMDHLVEHNLWWRCWWRVFPHAREDTVKTTLRRAAR